MNEGTPNYMPHYVAKALSRLTPDKTLCRQSSDTDEAVKKGGGFIYFITPGGKPFPPASGRWLIEQGKVKPRADGLFEGQSQSFKAVQN